MRPLILILLGLLGVTFRAAGDGADYKQVLVEAHGDAVRVRLPLTDVTGKVRVKEKSPGGFGLPVAPMKMSLGKKYFSRMADRLRPSRHEQPKRRAPDQVHPQRRDEIRS